MAVTFKGPLNGNAEYQESQGVPMSVVTTYLCEGLTDSGSARLQEALDELESQNSIVDGYVWPGNSNLAVTDRSVRLVGSSSPGQAIITVTYSNIADAGRNFIFKGSASLNQIETDVDNIGPLIVSYTYPDDYYLSEFRGLTFYEQGTASVMQAQQAVTGTGLASVDIPQIWAAVALGKVNGDDWGGYGPGVWLCTSVSYEPVDLTSSPSVWRFTVELQANTAGWDPWVAFVDDNTGAQPPDLDLNGRYQIIWYPRVSYQAIWPE